MHYLNKHVATVLISGFALALVLLAPTVVKGDDWNLATRFSINQQFEVPGAVLEANTPYVIRLYDSPSTRHVVQILNEDQTRLITMFMGIRDERMQPTDDTKFTFMESAPGFPLPIKEWFYPGRLSGLEFIYPKAQLERIAGYRTATRTTEVAVAEPVVEPAPEQEIAQAEPEPAPVEEPAVQEETQIAQLEEPPAIQPEPVAEEPAPVSEEPARELPRTAGELPLIGLIGMLCLGAGLGLKVLTARQ
jgi:hypothetical protein